MLEYLLLGFMTSAWGAQTLALGYVLYRYVYTPWRVMRADIRVLSDALNAMLAEKRRVTTLSPEDEYHAEARAAARRRMVEE